MKPPLRFCFLGCFEVWRGTELLSPQVWRTRKHAALLKILVGERRRMVPADRLIEWLWPHLRPEAGLSNLHVGISLLRRVLEPELESPADSSYILTHHPGYLFNPAASCWIDVDEFGKHIAEARVQQRKGDSAQAIRAYEAAEALYRGSYLPDDLYEDWAIGPRERLLEEYLTLLGQLHRLYMNHGDGAAALRAAQRALALDPSREDAHRQAMNAYYALGRRTDALHQFERCRDILRKELGVEPMPRTRLLHQRILSGDAQIVTEAQAVRPGLGPLPFVGREAELATLHGLLNKARREGLQVALISGEAGVGKTRLLDEFALSVRQQDVTLLRARCHALEQDIPYHPLREALSEALAGQDVPALAQGLGAWACVVAGMLPLLWEYCRDIEQPPALAPGEEQARLLHGLGLLLQGLAKERALVLFVDDVHWADGATLQALHYLSRHVQRVPSLFVAAYRTEELQTTALEGESPLQQLLASLRRECRPVEMPLQRLSQTQVTALTAAVARSPYGGKLFSQRLYRATEGNPLFLAETLRALFDQGVLYRDEYGSLATDFDETTEAYEELPMPATVRDVVVDRCRQLSAQQQRALAVAAVIGRAFTFDLWLRATRAHEGELLDTLEQSLARHLLVRQADGWYDFSHGLIGEVLCRELSPERCRILHRWVAEALNEQGVESLAGEIAHHYLQAEMWEEALEYLEAAGQSALRLFAHQEAWPYFAKAYEVLDQLGIGEAKRRYAILRQMVHLCGVLGQRQGADAYIHEALALARELDKPGQVGEMLQALCRHYFIGGEMEQALELSKEAVDLARRTGDIAQQASALRQHGYLCYRCGRHDQAFPALEEALRLSRQAGDRHAEAQTLNVSGVVYYYGGNYAQALALWKEALRVCREVGFKPVLAQVAGNVGELYRALGCYASALVFRHEALSVARDIGFRTIQPDSLLDLGRILSDLGRHEEAIPFIEDALTLASEVGHRHFVVQALNGLALVRLRLGGQDGAQGALELAQRALEEAREIGLLHGEAVALSLQGRALLAMGQVGAACDASQRAVELLEKHGVAEGDEAAIYYYHAQDLSAQGDEARAATYLSKAEAQVQARAARIGDAELCQSFLQNVPINRVICQSWREAHPGA
jgi:DNA-binding SARP family transcriptional activator